MLTNLKERANYAEGVQYATKSFCGGCCGSQTCTWMPRQAQKRTSAEGKSLPCGLPTQRGSRSKVSSCGLPCVWSVWATDAQAVSAVKSSRTCASTRREVPTSSSTPRFDDVLLLAEGIGRHRAHIFAIQLPAA